MSTKREDQRLPRWQSAHHSPRPELQQSIQNPDPCMDQRMPKVPMETTMHKPPVHCGDGFLGFDEPLKGWGDSRALASLISSFNFSSSVFPAWSIKTEISDYASSPSYQFVSSTRTVLLPSHLDALTSTYILDPITHSLAYILYKPVAKKVQPVLAPLEEEYRVLRRLPDNPLTGLVPLPTHPPEFVPRVRFTQARSDALDLNPANWLWPKELKLVRWIVP